MLPLKQIQGKRGKLVSCENYHYKTNKKTAEKLYLERIHQCGSRMIVDAGIQNVLAYPKPHDHPEENTENLAMEKLRQNMKKIVEKDPTQNLKDAYDKVLEKHPRQLAPDYRAVRSCMYRVRAKKVPPIPPEKQKFGN